MTNQQHPTTPPPELIKQLEDDWFRCRKKANVLLIQAYQAGADQELEACCDWVSQWRCMVGGNRPEVGLRAARRPKPPSLKEQALHILDTRGDLTRAEADTIRKALEALPND
jgi:hypothetical protein